MRFAVLSDTHYISKSSLYGEGSPRDLLRHDINVSVFEALQKRTDIDTVLITGDLTDAGDMDSHVEFVQLLKQLKATGKNVYVLTATHDFHFSHAWVTMRDWPVKYKQKPWERPWCDLEHTDYKALVTEEYAHLPAEACVPQVKRVAFPDDLWELYRDFGRDQAFSVCESAYSYAVKLEEKLWCLMLNNNFRDVDANFDFSPTYSPACFRWIEEIVRQAKEEGAFVFACTHHPLVPPVPAYKIGGTPRNMRNPTVCHTLADIGITLVFSGHTHFANVAFGSSDRGNVICDVTTPSICYLPAAYRLAELDAPGRRLKLTSVAVEKTPDLHVEEPTMKEHFRKEFIADQEKTAEKLPHGLGKIALAAEVRHFYPLCKKASGLTPAEYARIKNKRIFGLVMDAAVNMQTGDGSYTPDTPEYKFLMGLCAVLDSVIETQPFYPVEKKLQGYTISEIVEPMLYKKGIPDNDAEFIFDRLPDEGPAAGTFRSNAGDVLMLALSAAAALISPLSPAVTALALPTLTLLKKKRIRRRPCRPERY